MTQLTRLQLDDGTSIYVETTDTPIEKAPVPQTDKELTRAELGKESKGLREFLSGTGSATQTQEPIVQSFQAVEGTIRAYTNYTLNAFKKVASAIVDKVTLEFGIKVGGKAGIPYVTEGTAESNLKITVVCSFPDSTANNK